MKNKEKERRKKKKRNKREKRPKPPGGDPNPRDLRHANDGREKRRIVQDVEDDGDVQEEHEAPESGARPHCHAHAVHQHRHTRHVQENEDLQGERRRL